MPRCRKTRTFTVSHPPPYKARVPVRRTKTYTGCWTCRDRGIKCDEQRPECRKCLDAEIHCEGYSVRLVWEDEQNSGQRAQRRALIPRQDPGYSSLTVDELNSALAEIDSADIEPEVAFAASCGPFSVFQFSQSTSPSHEASLFQRADQINSPTAKDSATTSPAEGSQQSHAYASAASVLSASPSTVSSLDGSEEDNNEHSCMAEASFAEYEHPDAAMAMISIKQKVQPHVTNYLSSASPDERALLHYWITELSEMMIPTPRRDNPFRTIFIPLALAASDSTRSSSANVALLHAIYAVSAFNQARIPTSPAYVEGLGTKHHEISLRHLWMALSQDEAEADSPHREAILATIITMSSIEVMIGASATWRTHLAGGKSWLRSTIASNATQSESFWTLCQIFICIDTLGNPGIRGLTPSSILEPLETRNCPLTKTILDKHYCLEELFGITKSTLEAIMRIKHLSTSARQATEEEISDLEVHIRVSDPDTLVLDIDGSEDGLARHHTCAFFCAAVIYFERRLKNTPATKLQRLVRRSLDHLEAIRTLEVERGYKVCGLFWPEFVTACEAEDVAGLRARSLRMFEKGQSKGIGNITSAKKVVLDLWQRRDCSTSNEDISWENSMAKLGLDIILT